MLLIAACSVGGLPAEDAPVEPTLTSPQITSLTLTCAPADNVWQLDVDATSWTNGGVLYWTLDGAYVERHPVRSREAEPDGSGDALRLSLDIVPDWRDARAGSSTAFLCTDTPGWRVFVVAPDGTMPDCRFDGDPSDWASQPDVPACETPQTPDSGA